MDPNQVKIIIGILLLAVIVSFFFKVTRKLAVWGIVAVLCLGFGFLVGIAATKDHIKKNHPVCHEVIYSKK
ncbi:MAG: hypothetical protein KDD32_03260 [Bacteroidetes bacterium]|nr:hypothetical protein [Bacteroidota bacterium]